MGEENSEKFLCPECGKKELEDLDWGFKCGNCGYKMRRFGEKEQPWPISKKIIALLEIVVWTPLIILFLVPLLFYFFVLFAICFYMAVDIHNIIHIYYISGLNSDMELEIESLSRMVLYVVLSLALIDLTGLISEQYLVPASKHISCAIKYIWYGNCQITTSVKENRAKSDRRYIAKVITISVILVLMHTFYGIFDCSDNIKNITPAFATLISGCLFGAAAILIAVGLWKVLDSKGEGD